jgi:hypothetical protein
MTKLLLIDAPHFCAGIVIEEDGYGARSAPIIKYMSGWSKESIYAYCKKKNWSIKEVDTG